MRNHASISDIMVPRRLRANVEIDPSLVASIRQHGVLHPILVTAAGDGRYTLVDGERRLAHARAAGKHSVPITEMPEKEALEQLMIEREANRHRQDWNCLEDARYYQRLQDEHGWTQAQIASAEDCSQARISQHLKLLAMVAEAQDAIIAGLLDFTAARQVSRINDSPALQRRLIAHIKAKAENGTPLTSRGIRSWVGRERASDETLAARRLRRVAATVETTAPTRVPSPSPVLPQPPAVEPAGVNVAMTEAMESGADPLAAMLLRELRETLAALAQIDGDLLHDPELEGLWADVQGAWEEVAGYEYELL